MKKLLGLAGVLVLLAGLYVVAQQPVNTFQINGVAPTMGNGVSGTGVQRVTIASDSTGQVALAAGSAAVGTVQPGNTQNTTPWLAQATPESTTTYAATPFDLSATAATQVKSSGGNVYAWYGFNPNTSTCYLQFYNSTSATLGTSPLHAFGVLAGASFNVAPGSLALFNLSTGISTGQTTTATGSTQCSSAMVVTILYD